MADQVKFYKDTYDDANALTHDSSVPNGAIIEASHTSGPQSGGERLYLKDSSGNVHNIGESLGTLNIYHQDTTISDALVVKTKVGNNNAKTALQVNNDFAVFNVPIEATNTTIGGSGDDGAIYIKDSEDDPTITLDGGNGSISASGSMSVSVGAIQLGDDSPFYGAVTIGKSGSSGSVAIKNSSNIGTIGLDGSDGSISAYSIETLGTGGITISNTDSVTSKLEIKPSGTSEQIVIAANQDMFVNTDENLAITSKQSTTASPSNKTATIQYGNVRILGDNKTVTSGGSTYKYWDSPIYLQTSGHGWTPLTLSNGKFSVDGFGLFELKVGVKFTTQGQAIINMYRSVIPCEDTADSDYYYQPLSSSLSSSLSIRKDITGNSHKTYRISTWNGSTASYDDISIDSVYYRWIYKYNIAESTSQSQNQGGSSSGSGGSGNSGPTPENQ